MKFHFTDEKPPEPYVDVLAYYLYQNEFHVLYIADDGKWYRRCDTDTSNFSPPHYWAELPSIEEVENQL